MTKLSAEILFNRALLLTILACLTDNRMAILLLVVGAVESVVESFITATWR